MSAEPAYTTLRTETEDGVRSIVLTRSDEYNTITPALRDELGRAIDEADAAPGVRVILLRAEGNAFCAGYGLDWSTRAQADEHGPEEGEEPERAGDRPAPWQPDNVPGGRRRAWDSVSDMRMIGSFVDVYMKLWYARKPTLAAVQGWCIGGGTDMVLCADMVLAGEGARFGYPPSRVWGTPTTAMWVYRMGLERAKRYLLTGDEITAPVAAEIGLILECVPDAELQGRAMALARRMAMVPTSQLVMLKMLCNQTAEQMGLGVSRTLGTLFDGIARHTQEGLDFVDRADAVGFRDAVRERDDPFGDYGSRPRKR
jgi:enoyl-CoA hydratase